MDPKTFYLESADRMAQCTLRTDLNPGVGPSGDQLYPYEVRAACRLRRPTVMASRRKCGSLIDLNDLGPPLLSPRDPGDQASRSGELLGRQESVRTVPKGDRPPRGLYID